MSTHDETRDELTEEERKALRALRDVETTDPHEEEAVLRALRERGLVGGARGRRLRTRWTWAAAAAALLATFLAGAEYGSRRAAPPSRPAASIRVESFAVASAPQDARPRFDEYRDEPDRPGRGPSVYPKIVAE